jgi:hypothetical protein
MSGKYQVDFIPEMQGKHWMVDKFKIDRETSNNEAFRSIINGHGRYPYPGGYTRLSIHKNGRRIKTVMSDTNNEIQDHIHVLYLAMDYERQYNNGGLKFKKPRPLKILINGLGLGVLVNMVLSETKIFTVRVIEIDQEVIDLISPFYKKKFGDRFEVIHANAFDYKPSPGEEYAIAWHDVWNDICEDNLEGIARLHRKWGRRVEWQGSWLKEFLIRMRRRNKSWRW